MNPSSSLWALWEPKASKPLWESACLVADCHRGGYKTRVGVIRRATFIDNHVIPIKLGVPLVWIT